MKSTHSSLFIVTTVFSTLATLIGVGTFVFHHLEDWTWIQSFYFTVATISTVGYGDLPPTNDTTRLFASFYILFGVVIAAGIVSFYGNELLRSNIGHFSRTIDKIKSLGMHEREK